MSSPLEGTDQTAVGRDRAGQLIRYVHENAFDARAEVKNLLVDEGKAAIEADFAGTHTGEFAGSSLRAEPSVCRIRFFTTCVATRSAGCGSTSR